MRNEKGFTLIELVMVIVLLGILAAVAIPKFLDLSTEAKSAALKGVVGGINSASAVNYASRNVSSAYGYDTRTANCDTIVTNILQGGIPTGYTVNPNAVAYTSGVSNNCVVTQTSSASSSSIAILQTPW